MLALTLQTGTDIGGFTSTDKSDVELFATDAGNARLLFVICRTIGEVRAIAILQLPRLR